MPTFEQAARFLGHVGAIPNTTQARAAFVAMARANPKAAQEFVYAADMPSAPVVATSPPRRTAATQTPTGTALSNNGTPARSYPAEWNSAVRAGARTPGLRTTKAKAARGEVTCASTPHDHAATARRIQAETTADHLRMWREQKARMKGYLDNDVQS